MHLHLKNKVTAYCFFLVHFQPFLTRKVECATLNLIKFSMAQPNIFTLLTVSTSHAEIFIRIELGCDLATRWRCGKADKAPVDTWESEPSSSLFILCRVLSIHMVFFTVLSPVLFSVHYPDGLPVNNMNRDEGGYRLPGVYRSMVGLTGRQGKNVWWRHRKFYSI